MKTKKYLIHTREDPLYNIWIKIHRRCFNPKEKAYSRYGGRGITVCERWSSFKNFSDDMRPSYKKGLTLDRIDNNGNYLPDNCRWATYKEQNNNRRDNRKFTINGITKNLAQWCDDTDIKPSTVRQRFYGLKWPIEKALFNPLGKRG